MNIRDDSADIEQIETRKSTTIDIKRILPKSTIHLNSKLDLVRRSMIEFPLLSPVYPLSSNSSNPQSSRKEALDYRHQYLKTSCELQQVRTGEGSIDVASSFSRL